MAFIRVQCPGCDHPFRVSDEKESVKVRCKECGDVFTVKSETNNGITTHPNPKPSRGGPRKEADSDEASRREERREREAEEYERSRRKREKIVYILVAIHVGIGIVVALGFLIGIAVSSSSRTQQPEFPGRIDPFAGQQPNLAPIQKKDQPQARPQPGEPKKEPQDFPQLPPNFPQLPPNFPQLPPNFPKFPDKPLLPPREPAKPPHASEGVKWEVNPDPGPSFGKGNFNLQTAIDVKPMSPLVFSTAASSPYVVLSPAKTTNVLAVVDLRTMKQYGTSITGKFDAFTYSHMALSPDGDYLAVRVKQPPFSGKDEPTKVGVWSVATGKQIHQLEIDPDPKFKIGLIDFLGKDRMFVMKHEDDFPDPSSKATYQTWDLKTGKVVSEFSTNNVYLGKWAGLSPGRRYMIQEETGTVSGYHLLVWDLTTGKRVGDKAFQDRKAPWGQAAGFAFSPDGEQVAMLWRLGQKPDCWGRLLCWDVRTGKKVYDHKLGYSFANIDSLWSDGGTKTIQWIPDKSGWLLFCHVLIDRESGAVLGKLSPEPNSITIEDRRFLDRDHISTGGNLPFNTRLGVSRIPWDRMKPAAP